MNSKPEYIKFIEKTNQTILSQMSVYEVLDYNKIVEQKLQQVYLKSDYIENKVVTLEIVYKSNAGFYLYIERNRLNKLEAKLCVFYEPQQHNELLFFLKSFINLVKK